MRLAEGAAGLAEAPAEASSTVDPLSSSNKRWSFERSSRSISTTSKAMACVRALRTMTRASRGPQAPVRFERGRRPHRAGNELCGELGVGGARVFGDKAQLVDADAA